MKLYEKSTVATYELAKHDHNKGLSCPVFLLWQKMIFFDEYFEYFSGVLLVWPDIYLEYCYMHIGKSGVDMLHILCIST